MLFSSKFFIRVVWWKRSHRASVAWLALSNALSRAKTFFFFFAFCLFRTLHQQSVPCCPLAGLSWMSLNRNISLKEMKNMKNNIKYVFCYFLYECYSNQASKLNIKNINQGLGGPNFQDLKNMSLEAQTWIFWISQYIRQLSTIVVKFCTKKSKFFI